MAEHESSEGDSAARTDADAPLREFHDTASDPSRPDRLALRTLQVGAIAVVLVAVTWKEFELDRFFVPKELVLHCAAFTAALFAFRALTRMRFSRVDLLLTGYLLVSAISAVMAANGWVATRALAVSVSGVLVFWTARALRTVGLHRPLLGAVAAAVVIGTTTALMQTYGIRTEFFSLNRAPGGTLGNRNFIAHLAAFGLPVVLFIAVSASRWWRYLVASMGAMLVAGTLVLTRSRAGFVALAVVLFVLMAALLVSPRLRRHGPTWGRVAGIAVLASAGIAAAVLVPNSLNWRSDNPYLESITGVANYQEGSGRGRLVQYRQSMLMAARNPVLGVGPGNWAVEYADYAAQRDPSLDHSSPGTTSNPWPSSDWVAAVSERGFAAALLMGLALAGIAITALRRLVRADDAGAALEAAALLATIAAAAVAGMFDAVMLLPQPALLVWAAAGALWEPRETAAGGVRTAGRIMAVAALVLLAGVGTVRSLAQVTAMGIYTHSQSPAWLERAAFIDPGNYRLRVRLAARGSGLDRAARCEHALAARDLFPNAGEARALSSGCD